MSSECKLYRMIKDIEYYNVEIIKEYVDSEFARNFLKHNSYRRAAVSGTKCAKYYIESNGHLIAYSKLKSSVLFTGTKCIRNYYDIIDKYHREAIKHVGRQYGIMSARIIKATISFGAIVLDISTPIEKEIER